METKEFFPEGWNGEQKRITKEDLMTSLQTGKILEAKVDRCDLRLQSAFSVCRWDNWNFAKARGRRSTRQS